MFKTLQQIYFPFFFGLAESFVVCQNYAPPKGYVPNMSNPLLDHHYGKFIGCENDILITSINYSKLLNDAMLVEAYKRKLKKYQKWEIIFGKSF